MLFCAIYRVPLHLSLAYPLAPLLNFSVGGYKLAPFRPGALRYELTN